MRAWLRNRRSTGRVLAVALGLGFWPRLAPAQGQAGGANASAPAAPVAVPLVGGAPTAPAPVAPVMDDPAAAASATPGPVAEAFERLPNGDLRLGAITLHRQDRELSFAASLCTPEMPLEVLVSTPQGRAYEALLVTQAKPLHLQTLLLLLDLQNGPRLPDAQGRQGDIVDIDLEWQRANGERVREPVEAWILDLRTKTAPPRRGWVFVGSTLQEGVFLADVGGNLAVCYSCGDTVLDIPDPTLDQGNALVLKQARQEPPPKSEVRVFVVPRPKAKTGTAGTGGGTDTAPPGGAGTPAKAPDARQP